MSRRFTHAAAWHAQHSLQERYTAQDPPREIAQRIESIHGQRAVVRVFESRACYGAYDWPYPHMCVEWFHRKSLRTHHSWRLVDLIDWKDEEMERFAKHVELTEQLRELLAKVQAEVPKIEYSDEQRAVMSAMAKVREERRRQRGSGGLRSQMTREEWNARSRALRVAKVAARLAKERMLPHGSR